MMKFLSYLLLTLFFIQTLAAQEQFSVYFESNQYEISSKEKEKLDQWILANASSKVIAISGYTDEDGTSGFNDTLAKKRVDFIHSYLKGKVKTRDDFKTRTFGENFKQSKTKAENRRVTLFYLQERELHRENEILGIPEKIEEVTKPSVDYPEKLVLENPNGTTTEFKLDRDFMKRMNESKAGEKLKIENLNFVINTFAIVPESRAKLYELLLVLQNNPGLKIEIQGHLCCMPNDRLDLSTQRAKAVYQFLVKNDIYPGRLSYKGFGSTQPIFSIPEKSEQERAANRRVEILILSNE